MSNADLILRLLLQLAVILATCRLVGMIGRRLGQAQVVSEMVAGILLGPSFFGLFAPNLQRMLFPQQLIVGGVALTHPSMSILYVIAHLGVALYMFLVGLDFETRLFSGQRRQAGAISIGGILGPFALGAAFIWFLYQPSDLLGSGVTPVTALLFFGAALSVTAFPVLARLLQQYQTANTRFGTVILAAAAVDDIAVWCLLALALASQSHSPIVAFDAIGGGALYTVAMLTLMAIVTTLLATPLYRLIYGRRADQERSAVAQETPAAVALPTVQFDLPDSASVT